MVKGISDPSRRFPLRLGIEFEQRDDRRKEGVVSPGVVDERAIGVDDASASSDERHDFVPEAGLRGLLGRQNG